MHSLTAHRLPKAMLACAAALAVTPAPADASDKEFWQIRTGKTDFKYVDLGAHVPARSGRRPFPLARFVVAPDIGMPMEIDLSAGEHMYCNSQFYNIGGGGPPTGSGVPGGGVNSPENYYFPWTSNFCEKRGRSGDLVCGTQYQEHMGQDCRPPKPTSTPKYWVLAVDDGIASNIGASHSIAIANDRFRWVYLHMANRQVQPGQRVRKGQRIGQVWNIMQGGTSIHLHIEVKFKDQGRYRQLDPLPSLINAYHKALGNTVPIEADGTLGYDPRFEIRGDSAAPIVISLCGGAESRPSIGTENQFNFTELWCHNGSLMGLVEEGDTRRLIYFKVRSDSLADSVKAEPVLVELTKSGDQWSGKARHYSSRCGNRQFDVSGTPTSPEAKRIELTGTRDSFPGASCENVTRVTEALAFTFVSPYPPPAPTAEGPAEPPPAATDAAPPADPAPQ